VLSYRSPGFYGSEEKPQKGVYPLDCEVFFWGEGRERPFKNGGGGVFYPAVNGWAMETPVNGWAMEMSVNGWVMKTPVNGWAKETVVNGRLRNKTSGNETDKLRWSWLYTDLFYFNNSYNRLGSCRLSQKAVISTFVSVIL